MDYCSVFHGIEYAPSISSGMPMTKTRGEFCQFGPRIHHRRGIRHKFKASHYLVKSIFIIFCCFIVSAKYLFRRCKIFCNSSKKMAGVLRLFAFSSFADSGALNLNRIKGKFKIIFTASICFISRSTPFGDDKGCMPLQ